MNAAAFLGAVLLAGVTFSDANASDENCEFIRSKGASFLRQCGSQLWSFALELPNPRWQLKSWHGIFLFNCFDLPPGAKGSVLEKLGGDIYELGTPCSDEPEINGFFIGRSVWQASEKNEKAILHILREHLSAHYPTMPLREPLVGCPEFELSIGHLSGRAVCFVMDGKSWVSAIFSEDRVAFLLNFVRDNENLDVLKAAVLKVLPQFNVEHATGDASLLRWVK